MGKFEEENITKKIIEYLNIWDCRGKKYMCDTTNIEGCECDYCWICKILWENEVNVNN